MFVFFNVLVPPGVRLRLGGPVFDGLHDARTRYGAAAARRRQESGAEVEVGRLMSFSRFAVF